MRAWIAPIAALLVTTTVAAAQSPIPSLKGRLEGNRKNPAVRNDRVPFGVSEGGRCSRPGGDPYRPGSGWAADLGNDIGRKQRRQGAVCVGGHGGQQDHHRRRYRRLLPHHDLVAGPDGEVLRAECRFVPTSDRSVLLCHVAGQSIVAELAVRAFRRNGGNDRNGSNCEEPTLSVCCPQRPVSGHAAGSA